MTRLNRYPLSRECSFMVHSNTNPYMEKEVDHSDGKLGILYRCPSCKEEWKVTNTADICQK